MKTELSIEDQLLRSGFDEPLVPLGGPADEAESRELLQSVKKYREQDETDRVGDIGAHSLWPHLT